MIFVTSCYARSTKHSVITIEAPELVPFFVEFVRVDFAFGEKCGDCKQLIQPRDRHHILKGKQVIIKKNKIKITKLVIEMGIHYHYGWIGS
jgi:hypothetical protein